MRLYTFFYYPSKKHKITVYLPYLRITSLPKRQTTTTYASETEAESTEQTL